MKDEDNVCWNGRCIVFSWEWYMSLNSAKEIMIALRLNVQIYRLDHGHRGPPLKKVSPKCNNCSQSLHKLSCMHTIGSTYLRILFLMISQVPHMHCNVAQWSRAAWPWANANNKQTNELSFVPPPHATFFLVFLFFKMSFWYFSALSRSFDVGKRAWPCPFVAGPAYHHKSPGQQ